MVPRQPRVAVVPSTPTEFLLHNELNQSFIAITGLDPVSEQENRVQTMTRKCLPTLIHKT